MTSSEFVARAETGNRPWSLLATIDRVIFPDTWFWIASALLLFLDLAWIAAAPRISIAPDCFTRMLAPLGFLFVLAWIRQALPSNAVPIFTRITCAGMALLFVLLTQPALRIFNHLLMTLPLPLADGLLASWDEALGFQWLGYAKFFAGQKIVLAVMNHAYTYFYIGVLVVALEAALVGHFFRCRELLALTFVSAVTASLISCLFPARAAMDRYADEALRLQFSSNAGIFHIRQLMSLRGADPITLHSSALTGLSTFPSFHTAAGILIVYACRGNSFRLAVGATYSTIMIASTPLFGGHYFVDLIAGTILAIATIAVWRSIAVKPVVRMGLA